MCSVVITGTQWRKALSSYHQLKALNKAEGQPVTWGGRDSQRSSESFLYTADSCLFLCLCFFHLLLFDCQALPVNLGLVRIFEIPLYKNCNISAFVPATDCRDDKAREPRFDKSPFVCNHCCILIQTISLWQTQLRICYALPDSKGAEGAHINFISHTNHSFIWRYLFDNAHTVADVVIFWAE